MSDDRTEDETGDKPKTGGNNTVISDVSESDSEDDQTRSRTPLLARHSSLEQKQKVSCTSSDGQARRRGEEGNMSSGSSGHKRVSFSTRSLDGGHSSDNYRSSGGSRKRQKTRDSDHHRKGSRKCSLTDSTNLGKSTSGGSISTAFSPCATSSTQAMARICSDGLEEISQQNDSNIQVLDESVEDGLSGARDNAAANERRFVLAPQNDSLVGENLAGGPFPSQWLFQAVNVAVKKLASSMQPPINGTVGDAGTSDQRKSYDADSITSGDSQKSHSLVGLNLLFASNPDISVPEGDSGNAKFCETKIYSLT